MLGHCKMILERDGGRIAISSDKFDKLITSLRTAVDNDGTLEGLTCRYFVTTIKIGLKINSINNL
jgi:hypothetical protein